MNYNEKANIVAKKAAANGMKFTYHNHSTEFIKLSNGKTIMEMLVEGLDKDNATFCLDTYWSPNCFAAVKKSADYLRKFMD